jgi:hypothetical protein
MRIGASICCVLIPSGAIGKPSASDHGLEGELARAIWKDEATCNGDPQRRRISAAGEANGAEGYTAP